MDIPKKAVTGNEKYLAAILDTLIEIRDGMTPAAYSGDVLKVGVPAGVLIPDDFPGHDALVKDGFIYIETVPTTAGELVAIQGIGMSTAGKILAALGI